MSYTKEFEKLLAICKENEQYVGLGNPNAKILFIGKEAGMKSEKEATHGTAESWLNGNDYSLEFIPEEKKVKDGKHTWQKYQKLYELILRSLNLNQIEKVDKGKITFVENVFTTELNNLHAPTIAEAKKREGFKNKLKERKEVFFQSNFIKNFPIIIILSSDNQYIETYKGEVCKLFDVKFHEQLTCGESDKIWIHYADKGNRMYPKLVIHTRQLTNGASNDLLEKIARIIADFVKKHSIKIKVK